MDTAIPARHERLLSLDILRGLAVIGMMLVDWPGDWDKRYRLFEHAQWLGITAPDFIFPAFMFVAGVAIPYSLQARKDAGQASARLHWTILRRALLLFLVGYFLNLCWYSSPTVLPMDWSRMRLLGVLQRYAFVSPIVAILYLHMPVRRMLAVGLGILLVYWAVMTLLPVPGFGAPNLAVYPEGEVAPNLATWIDKTVLGKLTDCYPYDSEGILSTFPSIVTMLLGVAAGEELRNTEVPAQERTNRLFAWGLALVIAGYFWGMAFPLCKKLWTSSFVLFTGGWSLLFLGALHWTVDIQGRTSRLLTIPRDYGMNAIAAMVAFTFLDNVLSRLPVGHKADLTSYVLKDFLNDHLFRSWMSDRNASWSYSVVGILALSLLFRWFRQRGWFLRV